ncbi:CRIB domain-containing protein RIC4-like protein [Tanacetum coccineum]
MKDRMERLVAFPFANSCVSASSVAVCVQHGRRSKEDHDSTSHMVYKSYDMPKDQKDEDGRTISIDNIMKNSFRFLAPSKPNVSIRLQRLTKTIKCLSQSLAFKENMDDGQMEMEIGLPTDVKHVAHVGFDGSVTSEAISLGNQTTSDILGFCPISFSQLEERFSMCVPLDASQDLENMLNNAIQARNKTDAIRA